MGTEASEEYGLACLALCEVEGIQFCADRCGHWRFARGADGAWISALSAYNKTKLRAAEDAVTYFKLVER